MVIRKILETTLPAGSTSVSFTDSEIPLSLIRVYTSDPDVLPTERRLSGSTITISFEAQNTNMGVALEIEKAGLDVIDTLDSDNTEAALSAKQGKVLKTAIDSIVTVSSLSGLIDVVITDPMNNDMFTYDSDSEKWKNTPFPSIPTDITDLNDVFVSAPVDGQVLTYDNGDWINANPPSGGGGVNYSSTEQDTGLKWTDGSTIYQKTIELNSFSFSSNWSTIYTDASIRYLVSVELTNGESLMNARLNYQFYQNNLQCTSTNNFTLTDPKFTIRYLKTS